MYPIPKSLYHIPNNEVPFIGWKLRKYMERMGIDLDRLLACRPGSAELAVEMVQAHFVIPATSVIPWEFSRIKGPDMCVAANIQNSRSTLKMGIGFCMGVISWLRLKSL